MNKVVHTYDEDGDWEGLYVNGVLISQGHSIQLRDLCKALGVDYQSKEVFLDSIDRTDMPKDISEFNW